MKPSAPFPDWADSLEALLAPLPGDNPCGPWLRYDPLIARIRQAREADDASLPMGEWERPLKLADWQQVETLCIEGLMSRSKDIQLACWLMEAAFHRNGIPGLEAGTRLLSGLLERYWDTVHPLIEEGDSDARSASLVWLNESLPLTLRLEATLLPLPGRKPARLVLEDWERLGRQAAAETSSSGPPADELPSRETLLQIAGEPASLSFLHALREQVQQTLVVWKHLSALVDEKLGRDAPSLSRVADSLVQLLHGCSQLIAGRAAKESIHPSIHHIDDSLPDSAAGSDQRRNGMADFGQHPARAPDILLMENALQSRVDAYKTLEDVADYLQRIEPHSPTPYLIRRAVKWGRMPLPTLMQELLREEGDLNRLFTVLGLDPGLAE